MARYESGNDFVELWLDGSRALQRVGSHGEEHLAATTVLAEDRYSGGRELAQAESHRLIAGWRRVWHPGVEAELPDEPRDAALDAALFADPGDAAAAAVYSDWLQGRGHPRGALIATQAARLGRPDDGELRDAEAALLAEHADVLLGPLAALIAEHALELTWERGFVRAAKIGRRDPGAGADALWEVARHPSARFLRELVIGCHEYGDQNNRLMAALISRGLPPLPLRALVLADFDHSEIDNIDISRAPIGDVSRLGAAYPQLTRLELKGTGDVELGGLVLPRLREFALRTSTLQRRTLGAICELAWRAPELAALELWLGDPDDDYGAEVTAADLARLFTGPLPALRALAIRNAVCADDVVTVILAWPGAAQLESLDFALGGLTDAGVAELAVYRERIPNVRRLGVFNCALGGGAFEVMREAGFVADSAPIAPNFEGNPEMWQQKTRRYASVSE